MIWPKYQIDKHVQKVSQDLTLWETEKVLVKLNQNSLAVLIKMNDINEGYTFHGEGRLVLDAIIEAKEGAIGKAIERELKDPFLMLGNTERINSFLETASDEDLVKAGYENCSEIAVRAQELLEEFFGKSMMHKFGTCRNNGVVFAFQNEVGKFDLLIAKDSKIVFKTTTLVFIANGDQVVLKTPQKVILSRHKKHFIIT